MTQLIFCGQAPSRIGDGRPFSGPNYWNHRANVLQAANFFKRLLNRSGISIER